jgi:hypothetical protein
VSFPSFEIINDETNAHSGTYLVKTSGIPTSSSIANYSYRIAEISIPVVTGLQFSFWKKTTDEPGRFVSADLVFKSGKRLSKLPGYKSHLGGSMDPSSGIGTPGKGWEQFICRIGTGELEGDEITGIIITFDNPSPAGPFNAFFDDIFISSGEIIPVSVTKVSAGESYQYVYQNKEALVFEDNVINSFIRIFDYSGRLVADFLLDRSEVPVNLKPGIYIIMIYRGRDVLRQKILFYNTV